ncbi:MAG: AmmeMemoRadiSam system protein B [Planctomycetes bacterium]|nr:AmmeMemoRadiSam system protein B [Planctomycetota bacterium]
MGRRTASKAGTWYSACQDTLAREIEGYLEMAEARETSPVVAAIAPHAGLAYSGATAARAYGWIKKSDPDVETFVLFGAVHTCQLSTPAIWTKGEWETPLGPLMIDEELAAMFVEAGVAEDNEAPHHGDNAIELQTPFIRHCFPDVKIVPIAIPPSESAVSSGTAAWTAAAKTGRKIIAIGSTDLTHYGHAFGFMPAGEGDEAVEWSKLNDRKLIDQIIALNAESIISIAGKDHSACGAGAVAATVAWAKAAGCAQGKLLEHTTSYDVMPDGLASHFVGYGSLVFPAE